MDSTKKFVVAKWLLAVIDNKYLYDLISMKNTHRIATNKPGSFCEIR